MDHWYTAFNESRVKEERKASKPSIQSNAHFHSENYKALYGNCGLPGGAVVKNPLAKQEMQIWSLGGEDPLEKEMATQSSILAWEIPWMEEPPWDHKELDLTWWLNKWESFGRIPNPVFEV